MSRALRLARRARPGPNPRVGAVIVRDGEVVGEGFHRRAGEPHAEVNALAAAGAEARGATVYVTLEPCAHMGRTGPCTYKLIEAGVARVVVGSLDPNPLVNGRGVRALRRAGVEVDFDVSAAGRACKRMIDEWGVFVTTGLPFVRLKAAVSLDGRLATAGGDSRWITGEKARREAHRLRDDADAVMVGLGTVVCDDPLLTVRNVRPTGPPPIRVVLDPALEIPEDAALLRTSDEVPTLLVHSRGSRARLADRHPGLRFLRCRSRRGLLELGGVLAALAERGVTSVLVEGGGALHTSLLEQDLADAVSVFVAPVLIGGREAVGLYGGRGCADMDHVKRLCNPSVRKLGRDVLFEGRLR
jgi:diaminohydroxyphosphoribosylaminopyrimidine deaminase/5-amino-6-(5-phosphoribosylamino)uracil reductase